MVIQQDMVFDDEWGLLKTKQRTVTALSERDDFIIWHQYVIPRALSTKKARTQPKPKAKQPKFFHRKRR